MQVQDVVGGSGLRFFPCGRVMLGVRLDLCESRQQGAGLVSVLAIAGEFSIAAWVGWICVRLRVGGGSLHIGMAVVGKEKGVCVVVFFQAFGLTMQLFARVGGAIWIDRHWFV